MSHFSVPAGILSLLLAIGFAGWAQPGTEDIPLITKLQPSDLMFKQLSDAIAQGYQAEQSAAPRPDLFLCRWIASAEYDVFSLAARLALPYETLASLNGWANPQTIRKGETVLIPSMAGLFVPSVARNDFDLLLIARLGTSSGDRVVLASQKQRPQLTFFAGQRLLPTERSFFLNVGFRAPLPSATLTSSYGMRISPIDGHDRFHQGIDLAAPRGTPVYAARAGTVLEAGEDNTLGLFVVLAHEGGWKTVYGHLSSIAVRLNQAVLSGTILGAVGSTGLSTGPHLHFEIRVGGASRDPLNFVNGLSP